MSSTDRGKEPWPGTGRGWRPRGRDDRRRRGPASADLWPLRYGGRIDRPFDRSAGRKASALDPAGGYRQSRWNRPRGASSVAHLRPCFSMLVMCVDFLQCCQSNDISSAGRSINQLPLIDVNIQADWLDFHGWYQPDSIAFHSGIVKEMCWNDWAREDKSAVESAVHWHEISTLIDSRLIKARNLSQHHLFWNIQSKSIESMWSTDGLMRQNRMAAWPFQWRHSMRIGPRINQWKPMNANEPLRWNWSRSSRIRPAWSSKIVKKKKRKKKKRIWRFKSAETVSRIHIPDGNLNQYWYERIALVVVALEDAICSCWMCFDVVLTLLFLC